MILVLLFALQSAMEPASGDDPEIVVIARKMRQIEVDMKLGRHDGSLALLRCRVTRPSGEAELDAIPCEVAQQCMAQAPSNKKQLVGCVENMSNRRIDAIVAARRAAP